MDNIKKAALAAGGTVGLLAMTAGAPLYVAVLAGSGTAFGVPKAIDKFMELKNKFFA